MTIFDLIAVGVIVLSALTGFTRGAVRELIGLFAFTASAVGALATLSLTTPIARHLVHPSWLATAAAGVVTFVLLFVLLQFVAAAITASLDRVTVLGGANRIGGLVFGGLRGVILLGLFALMFNKVTPKELQPPWITGAMLYPLANASGRALQVALPKGLRMAGGLTPPIGGILNSQDLDDSAQTNDQLKIEPETRAVDGRSLERAKSKDHGYTKHARDSVDALVERSN